MNAFALPMASEPYVPPTISDTHLPDVLPWMAEYGTGFGKQMIMIILSIILIVWFFKSAIKNPKLVPSKVQFLAETAYGFVRNSVGRDIIGERTSAPGCRCFSLPSSSSC